MRLRTVPGLAREVAWWDDVAVKHENVTGGKMSQSVSKIFRGEQTYFWQSNHDQESEPDPVIAETLDETLIFKREEESGEALAHERTSSGEESTSRPSEQLVEHSPSRPVVACFQQKYADRNRHVPRFSMTRYLRLNGILQDEESIDRRWLQLPRKKFRATFRFVKEKTLMVEPTRSFGRAQWMIFRG